MNADPAIHGVLVQLPLPPALNAERMLQSIAAAKDVDGFNWNNLGAMVAGHTLLAPCTPLGVMTMLDRAGIAVEGRNAVVVGRSVIVGKPTRADADCARRHGHRLQLENARSARACRGARIS